MALQREAKDGLPLPERWYVSPMRRPMETVGIQWGWLYDDGYEYGERDEGPSYKVIDHRLPARAIEVSARFVL